MLKLVGASVLSVALGGAFGFNYGFERGSIDALSKIKSSIESQPKCDFNITGNISTKQDLFNTTHAVSIYFNGIDVASGLLDKANSGHFVGTYKDKPVTSDCSGLSVDSLTCQIDFDGKTNTLNFRK